MFMVWKVESSSLALVLYLISSERLKEDGIVETLERYKLSAQSPNRCANTTHSLQHDQLSFFGRSPSLRRRQDETLFSFS